MATSKKPTLNKTLKKADALLGAIDVHLGKYTGITGKEVKSQEAYESLDAVVRQCFEVYNDMVMLELQVTFPQLAFSMSTVSNLADKIRITDKTAKKLTLDAANTLWQQVLVASAVMCSALVEIQDNRD